MCWYTVIRNIAPGIRTRLYAAHQANAPTDSVDELTAGKVFAQLETPYFCAHTQAILRGMGLADHDGAPSLRNGMQWVGRVGVLCRPPTARAQGVGVSNQRVAFDTPAAPDQGAAIRCEEFIRMKATSRYVSHAKNNAKGRLARSQRSQQKRSSTTSCIQRDR